MENTMRKIVSLLCIVFLLLACLTSCEQLEGIKEKVEQLIGAQDKLPDTDEDIGKVPTVNVSNIPQSRVSRETR